jgi:O-antigen/teichoic acid export membrane protein
MNGEDGTRKIWDLFRKAARGDISTTMYGNMVRMALRAVATALIVFYLGKERWGLCYLAILCFTFGADIADLGMDTAGLRYISRSLRENRKEQEQLLLRVLLTAKIVLSFVVIAAGWLLAGLVADWAGGREQVWLIRIALLGIPGRLLIKYCTVYFKARQEFARNAVAVAVEPLMIVIGLAVLFWTGRFGAMSALAVYCLGPLAAFVVVYASPWMPKLEVRSWSGAWRQFTTLFSFGKFLFVTNGTASIRTRILSFYIAKWRTEGDVGIYGAGDQLSTILSILSDAILTTLVPKASSRIRADEIRRFLKRNLKKTTLMSLPLFLAIPLSWPAMALASSWSPKIAQYRESIPVFNLIFAGMLFSIISLPVRSVLYAVKKPQVETVIEIFMLALVAALGFFVVPYNGGFGGIIGAAAVMLVQRFLTCVVLIAYAYIRIYRDPGFAAAFDAESAEVSLEQEEGE